MVAECVTSTDGILTTSTCCENSSATYGVRLVCAPTAAVELDDTDGRAAGGGDVDIEAIEDRRRS
jgi:hypothetical protein